MPELNSTAPEFNSISVKINYTHAKAYVPIGTFDVPTGIINVIFSTSLVVF